MSQPQYIPTARASPESEDQLWTARDVARYLQSSKSWVYRAAEMGVLPSRRIQGLLRFVPHEVREFAIAAQR